MSFSKRVRSKRLRIVVALALVACVLAVVINSALSAPSGIGAGYALTYTHGGATCGEGVPLDWTNPGADPAAPGYKTKGQAAGYLRSPAGQALLGDVTACLPPDQQAVVLAAFNAGLAKPNSFFSDGWLNKHSHLQESSRHAAAPIIGPANFNGKNRLRTAIANIEAYLGASRWVVTGTKTNPDGGTTTYWAEMQDVIDAQGVFPYLCGNLGMEFRFRTIVLHRKSIRTVPVNVGKIAEINGKTVSMPDSFFTLTGCWTLKDPITGVSAPTPTCKTVGNVSTNGVASRAFLGYVPVGTAVTVTEINVPHDWVPVNGDGSRASYSQTLTTSNKELDFGFIDNMVVSGCACASPSVPVGTQQMINISLCSYDEAATPNEFTVSINGGPPQTVTQVSSAVDFSTFQVAYTPTVPGPITISVTFTDSARGFTLKYPDISATAYPAS